MSTIANLLSLIDPAAIKPFGEAYEGIERNRRENETGLIALAQTKQQQAAEQEFLNAVKNDPRVAQMLLGTIGSLPTTGGQPGAPASPSLTQQTIMPGQPPGAPQTVPGGQDLSQGATQGAPPPQSTIASLGPAGQPPPQAPQNPALEMARTNPRAALLMQQQIQGQQVNQLTMQERRLTWGTKVYEAIGQIAQGITDQASLDEGRSRIAQISPEEAARLPQFYAKEAIIPFVKRAVGVKDAAELQIKTIHEQNENLKVQAQLAQAGYQGLGDDVTGIIRGLSEEQVKQFGGRTTPAAIAYATEEARKLKPVPGQTADVTTELRAMKKDPWKADDADIRQAIKNIDDRALGRAQAAEVQRGQTERELRGEKTVSEVMGTKATNLFDTQTGETGNIAKMKIKDYEAMPEGRVKELSPRLTEQMENINISVPIVSQLQEHIDKIYGPGGVLARMSADERTMLTNAPSQWAKQYAQKYPELIQAQRFIDANKSNLSRALAGEKGSLSGDDVERAGALLPNLETALKVWPPTEIGWRQPDTKDVALRSMNSIVDMINARGRTLLGNEQYTHPKLHRYETAQDVQQGGGDPHAQPTMSSPAPPIPPLVGPNPNLPKVRQPGEIPVLGGPGMPEQYLPPPGKQSQAAPAPAPAPSAPAAKPTPGRQPQATTGRRGVELARASGIKVMDRQDIAEAAAQTGKTPQEVVAAARAKGYRIYGGGTAMA